MLKFRVRRTLWWMRLFLIGGAAAGCAPVLLVTGVVAGYAVSRDCVTVDLDRPLEKVWMASLEETNRLGRVKRENKAQGRIDAQLQGADVVVTLEQLTPSTVRVVVRARKHLLPQIETAQRLGVSIARRVG